MSRSVFLPTSRGMRHAVNTFSCSNTASISSRVRPAVSGKQNKMWMNAAKLNVPKMKYVLYAIDERPGGTAHASAKLNTQFVAVATDTAFPRTRIGNISAGYVHETGPMVMAKLVEQSLGLPAPFLNDTKAYLQTKKYEQTIMPLVTLSWPTMTQTLAPLTSPQDPKWPCRPPTSINQKPIKNVPMSNIGRRPHLSM